jgi:hypothetical protein
MKGSLLRQKAMEKKARVSLALPKIIDTEGASHQWRAARRRLKTCTSSTCPST